MGRWTHLILASMSGGYSADTVAITIDTRNISTGSTTETQFKIPASNTAVNYTVHWGDGLSNNITIWNQAETTHTYATAGVYTILLTGASKGNWSFNNTGDRSKLIRIDKFSQSANIGIGANTFYGCNRFVGQDEVTPVVVSGTLANMYRMCTSFNANFSNFSTTGVLNLNFMFYGCSIFNGSVNSFNTSSVTSSQGCFGNCPMFNQPLNSWNTANITNMIEMFQGATAFTQDISMWTFNISISLTGFMLGKSFANYPASNYDGLLINWNNASLSSKSIGMGTIRYTSAASDARSALISRSCVITDGGLA